VTSFPCTWQDLQKNGKWSPPTSNGGKFICISENCSLPSVDLSSMTYEALNPLPATATTDRCQATFECKTAGTYGLQLVVSDGCQIATSNTQVICRCSTRPVITVLAQTVVRRCDANKQLTFPEKQIDASIDTSDLPRLAACPVAPTPAPSPAVAPVERCCPTPPACPACPICPNARTRGCPACPAAAVARPQAGSIVLPTDEESSRSMLSKKYRPTAEGQARMALAKNRKALLNVASSSQSITAATIMSAQMPIVGLFVMSVLVNFVLFTKIRARRAQRKARSVLSPTAV